MSDPDSSTPTDVAESDSVPAGAQPGRRGPRHWLGVVMYGLLICGAPLVGMLVLGKNLGPYFAYPPRNFLVHEPGILDILHTGQLQKEYYILLAITFLPPLLITGVGLLVVLWKILRYRRVPALARRAFPRWGWWALLWTIAWWVIAWWQPFRGTELQRHTFTPLWLGYIAVANALSWRLGGRSMLIQQPRRLAQLFGLSALFWWGFEYLNRFVQNWYYVFDRQVGAVEYMVIGSISFSTVLPAVVATHDVLATFGWIRVGMGRNWRLPQWRLFWKPIAGLTCLLSLFLLCWVEPGYNVLYPILWVGPLLIVVSWQAFRGKPNLFSSFRSGDWRPVVTWALAALVCGFFWEMWNAYSLVQWRYQVPLVSTYKLFEMPILGYLGYIPFGWECAVAIGLTLPLSSPPRQAAVTDSSGDGAAATG